jgi:hypothetical protein
MVIAMLSIILGGVVVVVVVAIKGFQALGRGPLSPGINNLKTESESQEKINLNGP